MCLRSVNKPNNGPAGRIRLGERPATRSRKKCGPTLQHTRRTIQFKYQYALTDRHLLANRIVTSAWLKFKNDAFLFSKMMLKLPLNLICKMFNIFQDHPIVLTSTLSGSATGRKTFVLQNFIGAFLVFQFYHGRMFVQTDSFSYC